MTQTFRKQNICIYFDKKHNIGQNSVYLTPFNSLNFKLEGEMSYNAFTVFLEPLWLTSNFNKEKKCFPMQMKHYRMWIKKVCFCVDKQCFVLNVWLCKINNDFKMHRHFTHYRQSNQTGWRYPHSETTMVLINCFMK